VENPSSGLALSVRLLGRALSIGGGFTADVLGCRGILPLAPALF